MKIQAIAPGIFDFVSKVKAQDNKADKLICLLTNVLGIADRFGSWLCLIFLFFDRK